MKSYDQYLQTNNYWYPKIPLNWKVIKVKYIAETISGGTPSTQISEYWENGDIPWLPSGKLQNCEITTAEKFISEVGFNNSSTKWIKPNTVLVALTGATCANIGYLTFRACANQSVIAINENKNLANSRFLFYMFLEMRSQILTHQSGGAQAGINDSNVKNLYLMLPQIQEQLQIARYLDHQTSLIDEIINRKEKQIELLKEKRQAIINEAVTKGLNPDAKMKDSGIEWLGMIPTDWKITKSKYLTNLITDGAHISPDTISDDFPFISTVDLIRGEIDWNSCLKTTKESYEYLVRTGCKPIINDILYSKDGTIGKTTVITENKEFVVASSLIIIRPKTELINPFYFEYLLRSNVINYQIDRLLSGVALRRISLEKFSNLQLILPPLQIQEQILESLKSSNGIFLKTLDALRSQIEKLKEYRQSIISEAVTGKIDVRDWQPNNNLN